MSFLKDLLTVAPDELKTRFALGEDACGIYNKNTVMKYLIDDAKTLEFPQDVSAQEIQTYLSRRKEYNTMVAFIIYNQAFRKNSKNERILLRGTKAFNSLNFLTHVLMYPDYFEDNYAFKLMFYPNEYKYDKKTDNGLTPNQASALRAVEYMRLYSFDVLKQKRK